jgi:hypothetical protein
MNQGTTGSGSSCGLVENEETCLLSRKLHDQLELELAVFDQSMGWSYGGFVVWLLESGDEDGAMGGASRSAPSQVRHQETDALERRCMADHSLDYSLMKKTLRLQPKRIQ